MRKLLIAAAAVALAGPAAARDDPVFDERMDEEIARAIPPGAEVEAMAPVLDGVVGAILNVDVGPIVDSVDPNRRHRRYDRRDRTLGDMARRDDPYFEERLRSSIYGATADMGRMMDTLAVVAPAMRRSLHRMERDIAEAMNRRPPRRSPGYDPSHDPRGDGRDQPYERDDHHEGPDED